VSTTVEHDASVGDPAALIDDIEAAENTRAPLWAVYGPGGTWEAERKNILSVCALQIRAQSLAEGVKMTEAWLDSASHGHAEYVARVNLATEERTTMALLDAEIAAKTRRYELARARLYLSGRLAGLQ
jgi:vacuolar-type H+-ATPase subunit D/Vma8